MTEDVTLTLVQAMTAADALVEYGARHAHEPEKLRLIVSTLRALDYPASADALQRFAATLHEHSVRVDA